MTRPFTVYDPITGMILRSGRCQDHMFDQFVEAGEAILDGEFRADTHMVSNGAATMRPEIGITQSNGRSWTLAMAPPAGTTLEISAVFVSAAVIPLTSQIVSLEVAEPATVTITPPFPYRQIALDLDGSDDAPPPGAAILAADVAAMKTHYLQRVQDVGTEFLASLLIPRTDLERLIWIAQRDMLNKHRAGQLSATDIATVEQAAQFDPAATYTDILSEIETIAAFEDFVSFRHLGLQREATSRINTSVTAAEVIAAKDWTESEAISAVAQALQLKP